MDDEQLGAWLTEKARQAGLSEEEIPAAVEATRSNLRFDQSLQWSSGTVNLGGDLASVALGEGFRMLGPEDAGRVLVRWGNPAPDPLPLGMIFPSEYTPTDRDGWGIVVNWEEDGWVSDEDAAEIDYDGLLSEMKADTLAESEHRTQDGYEPIELVGWAAPPRYDEGSKKLIWAKELKFGDSASHTLNYDVRALGRRGVLSMNAVGDMTQLSAVEAGMEKLKDAVSFQQGHRYADFDPSVDQVAAFGIGALVAGKVAAKAGLFKGLLAVLLASKKLVIGGVVALLAVGSRLLGRGRREEPVTD